MKRTQKASKNTVSRRSSKQQGGSTTKRRIKKTQEDEDEFTLERLEILKVMGAGAFGCVYKVS